MPIIAPQRWSARPIQSREVSRTTDGRPAEVDEALVGEVRLSKFWFARRGILAAAVGALTAVLVLGLYEAGVLDRLERQSVDQRFSWRGRQSSGTDIVIVGIDQKTLQTLGIRPPLPRADYAQVLDRLHAASPRMIGIDTQFIGRSDPTDDNALLAAIARDGPVVLATHDGPQGPITVPADVPGAPGVIPASAAIEKDPDGVLRRMLYAPVKLESIKVRVAHIVRKQPLTRTDFPST